MDIEYENQRRTRVMEGQRLENGYEEVTLS